MKVIERDVIMVNKVYEASDLINMTKSFLNYIMMKISDKNQSKQQQQEPYVLTTTTTNDIGEDVLPQKLTKNPQKKKINKHKKIYKPKQNVEQVTGYFECDCMDHKPHQK